MAGTLAAYPDGMPSPGIGDTTAVRRRTGLVLGVGVPLLLLVILGTRELLQTATGSSPTREQLCSQYELLVATLTDQGLFATQAGNRAARKLSQQAERFDERAGATKGARTGEPPVAQAAEDIRTVLGSVAWETPDLIAATRPVALECGWGWPVSATPPAPVPQPPS
jgi:hypothetical protein